MEGNHDSKTTSDCSETKTAGVASRGNVVPEPLYTAGPITRALTRKRSFKRQAPAPPSASSVSRSSSCSSINLSLADNSVPSTTTPAEVLTSTPVAPCRTQSSHEAARKLAPLHTTRIMSPPPPATDGEATSPPVITPSSPPPVPSTPLGPVIEEVPEDLEEDKPTQQAPSDDASLYQDWSAVPRAGESSFSNTSRTLQRSDSIITVAHLYEDLYVVTPYIRVTLTNLTVTVIIVALMLPNTASMLYNSFRLVFGTLFPAYYSYKAVKTKNVKEYVKWMMYWIVFAFFTCLETVTDLFLAFWFPFYFELKILLVVWLLSPATRGSSVLYRKFVHPWLAHKEEEIDDYIDKAKQQGYSTVLQLGTKGVNYATTVLMQTAIKGGGGIVNQLKRSYSVGELNNSDTDQHDGDFNRNIKALPPNADYHGHGAAPPNNSRNNSQSSVRTVRNKKNALNSSNSTYSPSPTLLEEEQSSGDEVEEMDSTKQIRRSNRCRKTRLF